VIDDGDVLNVLLDDVVEDEVVEDAYAYMLSRPRKSVW
jgi:hypothetical protein